MSEESNKNDTIAKSDEGSNVRGAACKEIINGSNISSTPIYINCEMLETNNEEINSLPEPPGTSLTFQTMIHDLYNSSRRYSTFLSPSNIHQTPHYLRTNRHTSLPFIAPNNEFHLGNNLDFKKLEFESSRRSSFESAYHSQRSDPISRTETNSQLGYLEDSNNFLDELCDMHELALNNQMNLEQEISDRRNSLSYEAIRTYFLERNPYIQEIEPPAYYMDHRNHNSTFCHHFRRRRSSVVLPDIPFRTNAHQAVIEHQFEDLLVIPDATYSRSTSTDIFGGIGVPMINRDSEQNSEEEMNSNMSNENMDTSKDNKENNFHECSEDK